MRLPVIAVIFISFICGVSATETDDDEPFLKIMARSTVYNVGEIKAIFCKGKNLLEKIEWYSPSGNKVEERSTQNTRIYVERRVEEESFIVPLIIHNIKLTDAGNWTCKAGELSETIEFIVGEKAVIKDRNVKMEGEEGKSIVLTCEANGFPPPVVFWYKDGNRKHITSENTRKYVLRKDHSLVIKELDMSDIGIYVCKVRQKLLSHYTDKTVNLSVNHKPVIYNNSTKEFYTSVQYVEIFAIPNEKKNITCSVFANPPPTFLWYRHNKTNDELIQEEDTVVTTEDGLHSILILRLDDDKTFGQYKCAVNNSKGQEFVIFDVSPGFKPEPPQFVSLMSVNVSHFTFNVTCPTCIMEVELDEEEKKDPENLPIIGYTFQIVADQTGYPPDWDLAENFDLEITDVNNTLFSVGPLSNSTKYHGRVCTRNIAGCSEWFTILDNLKTTDSAVTIAASCLTLLALLINLSGWW